MNRERKPHDIEQLRKRLLIAPFHRWLGLNLIDFDMNELVLEMPWRDEIVSNPKIASAHGGILSALIDLTGLYTILAAGGTPRATIDLHVDFHRPALPGQLRAIGRLVKMGRQISVAETRVVGTDGALLASGRGAYVCEQDAVRPFRHMRHWPDLHWAPARHGSLAVRQIRFRIELIHQKQRKNGMKTVTCRFAAASLALTMLAVSPSAALAQKKYDPGASDTEIKIGNIMPYSGPASAYGVIGKTEEAYFKMINDRGGINGRKINFITYDDAYSPPKAVEQVRKLVESDEVLLVFNPLGTPSNTAIQRYLNSKKVPQLFVATGATKWNDPKNFPWTMGWQPSYQSEAHIYAKYLMKEKPNAKVAILYQNDDFGKDYVKGTKDGFGAKAANIIMEESHEVSEPTIDSHIVKIKAANPDVLLIYTTPKFGAQAIKKTAEIGWRPLQIMTNVSASVGSVMQPAGFDNAQGVISAAYAKDATDPQWTNDPGMKKWAEFVDKYMPGADKTDSGHIYGYGAAQTLAKVLEMCGDDLTRANIMKQAANLKDFEPDTLLPGIRINTGPTDFAPISSLQLMRFKGKKWELFGDTIHGDVPAE